LRSGSVHLSLEGVARSGEIDGGPPVDHAYKRTRTGGFDETIEAVERAVRDHGFVIENKYDIGGTVVAKGFAIRPLVIMEVSPVEEVGSPLSLVLPCRINIYEEDGSVVVAALRPTIFGAIYPEHRLDELAMGIETEVIGIVDDATAGECG
jgi:uncharacterized protein (DUF302 family)